MIHELPNTDLAAVRPLFAQPQLQLVIDAIIAGNANGDVWVDDPSCPQSACLWDRGPRFYLTGRDDNAVFNTGLGHVVAEKPLGSYLVVYCTSDAWSSRLSDIFVGRPFEQRQRCLYRLARLAIPNWRACIARDFAVQRIDRQLLTNNELANLDGLREEILSMWPSIDAFLGKAFGFCTIHTGISIACWSTAEYVSGSRLGIGIETVPHYQRQGLATLTASAFAEHCLSRNMDVQWDSWADNAPSIRVAGKVGFSEVLGYHVYQGRRGRTSLRQS